MTMYNWRTDMQGSVRALKAAHKLHNYNSTRNKNSDTQKYTYIMHIKKNEIKVSLFFFFFFFFFMSHKGKLVYLGLWSLEESRHRADLLEVFKMYEGLVSTPVSNFFSFNHVTNTTGHFVKLEKHRCRLDHRHHFLSVRALVGPME